MRSTLSYEMPEAGRLTPRSVIASTLLGMETLALPGRVLVRWVGLFGIAEGTARVALSRMVTAGELQHADGRYELTGRLRKRQAAQAWSRDPRPTSWDGSWTIYVVEEGRRGSIDRRQLREAMRQLYTAELRESVWMRPKNLPAEAQPESARRVVESQCLMFEALPVPEAAGLAARLFRLDDWSETARWYIEQMAETLTRLAGPDLDALAPTFLIATRALMHMRTDPSLPEELLPDGWPGPELRARFLAYEDAFRGLWRDWYHAEDR